MKTFFQKGRTPALRGFGGINGARQFDSQIGKMKNKGRDIVLLAVGFVLGAAVTGFVMLRRPQTAAAPISKVVGAGLVLASASPEPTSATPSCLETTPGTHQYSETWASMTRATGPRSARPEMMSPKSPDRTIKKAGCHRGFKSITLGALLIVGQLSLVASLAL